MRIKHDTKTETNAINHNIKYQSQIFNKILKKKHKKSKEQELQK